MWRTSDRSSPRPAHPSSSSPCAARATSSYRRLRRRLRAARAHPRPRRRSSAGSSNSTRSSTRGPTSTRVRDGSCWSPASRESARRPWPTRRSLLAADANFEYVRAVCDGNGSGEHWMWRQVLPDIVRRTGFGFDAVDDGGLAVRNPRRRDPGSHRIPLGGRPSPRLRRRVAVPLPGRRPHPRPLVVFVDDLHWADASSLKLLTYLARRFVGVDLLLVLTTRDPIGRVGAPARRHACQRLSLRRVHPSPSRGSLRQQRLREAVARELGVRGRATRRTTRRADRR